MSDGKHEIVFQLEIPREDLEEEQSIAEESENNYEIEVIEDSADFVPPVVVVIATATLSVIAIRMATAWLHSKEKGMVIDVRTTPAKVVPVANVPKGSVITIDKDGNQTEKKLEYDKPEDLVPFLSTVFGSGVVN